MGTICFFKIGLLTNTVSKWYFFELFIFLENFATTTSVKIDNNIIFKVYLSAFVWSAEAKEVLWLRHTRSSHLDSNKIELINIFRILQNTGLRLDKQVLFMK